MLTQLEYTYTKNKKKLQIKALWIECNKKKKLKYNEMNEYPPPPHPTTASHDQHIILVT